MFSLSLWLCKALTESPLHTYNFSYKACKYSFKDNMVWIWEQTWCSLHCTYVYTVYELLVLGIRHLEFEVQMAQNQIELIKWTLPWPQN